MTVEEDFEGEGDDGDPVQQGASLSQGAKKASGGRKGVEEIRSGQN